MLLQTVMLILAQETTPQEIDPEYKPNNDGKNISRFFCFLFNLTIFKIYLMGFLFLPLLSATLIWTFSLQMKKVGKALKEEGRMPGL